MTRTLIDISENTLNQLDELATSMSVSRAELVRQAIKAWLKDKMTKKGKNAFGILKNKLNRDGVEYQQFIRGEW